MGKSIQDSPNKVTIIIIILYVREKESQRTKEKQRTNAIIPWNYIFVMRERESKEDIYNTIMKEKKRSRNST